MKRYGSLGWVILGTIESWHGENNQPPNAHSTDNLLLRLTVIAQPIRDPGSIAGAFCLMGWKRLDCC